MTKRSNVVSYPPQLRAWLDAELVRRGFQNYQQLAADLKKEAAARGARVAASKSSLQRYGADLDRQLAAIRASTHAAEIIQAAAPDDEDKRSAASLSMLQTGFFDTLVALQAAETEPDPAKKLKLYARAGKAFAEITRASIHQKKWAHEVRGQVRERLDKLDAEAGAGKGKLDHATLKRVREEVYGIFESEPRKAA